jgi:hypothetical protein
MLARSQEWIKTNMSDEDGEQKEYVMTHYQSLIGSVGSTHMTQIINEPTHYTEQASSL